MKKMMILTALMLSMTLLLPLCACAEETDWYLEKAASLRDRLYEMISYDGLAAMYSPSEEISALLDSWEEAMSAEPESVTGYGLPPMELISEFTSDMENIPDVLLQKIERSLPSLLISQINGTMGVNFLAASSIPVLTEGYVMPDAFVPCIVLYEYEGICVSVSFTQLGEGVVSAAAQFCAPGLVEMLSEMPETIAE